MKRHRGRLGKEFLKELGKSPAQIKQRILRKNENIPSLQTEKEKKAMKDAMQRTRKSLKLKSPLVGEWQGKWGGALDVTKLRLLRRMSTSSRPLPCHEEDIDWIPRNASLPTFVFPHWRTRRKIPNYLIGTKL